jgi:hypothetical protein
MTDVTARFAAHVLEPLADEPAEWEEPITGAPAIRGDAAAERPFVPLDRDEFPAGAAEALERACGAWQLDQLLVIPRGARRIAGRGDRWFVTPPQVLAIGDMGAGLWVDAPPGASVRACLGADRLAAIDHVQSLRHARLTFVGDGCAFAVRYGIVARHEVERQLIALRTAAAGYPAPVPAMLPGAAVSDRCAHIARSAVISLAAGERAWVRAWRPAVGHRTTRSTVVAITSRELVVVRDPDPDALDGTPAYGHDSLHVPRPALERAAARPGGVRLRAAGSELEVALPRELADDVVRLLGRDSACR